MASRDILQLENLLGMGPEETVSAAPRPRASDSIGAANGTIPRSGSRLGMTGADNSLLGKSLEEEDQYFSRKIPSRAGDAD